MYQIKILKVHEIQEWQPNPNNPGGGAGESIEGAWLATKVTIQTSNTDANGVPLTIYETKDLLIPEPYSTEKLIQAVNDYKATLPIRNVDEGMLL